MRFARIPVARRVPSRVGATVDDLVLFDSWSGRYTDNPRAVSEAMHRQGVPLRQCWVIEPGREGPPWADAVSPGSRQHLQLLGRARFIVANNTLPSFFRKRPGTTLVQTWHGTPLKRIAFDLPGDGSRTQARYLAHLEREVPDWDLLVSPSPPATEWLTRAFRFGGRVLETGYPRNDVLLSPRAESERARARRDLGLSENARIVLYAPTFRHWGEFDLRLALDRLAEALGPDGHVLLRRHHLAGPAPHVLRHPRVHDVTEHPDDPRELFLAVDALITDYSSVMFDFALTGKPIVFFAYDLERYRDELRGFYFDFEAEAPGPIVRDSDEVVAALADFDRLTSEWRDRYTAFQSRFCSLEDGHAAERVVRWMLGQDRDKDGSVSAGGRFARAGKAVASGRGRG